MPVFYYSSLARLDVMHGHPNTKMSINELGLLQLKDVIWSHRINLFIHQVPTYVIDVFVASIS